MKTQGLVILVIVAVAVLPATAALEVALVDLSFDQCEARADEAFHQGDYALAIEYLEVAIKIDPGAVDTWSSIAWLQWSLGKRRAAERTLQRCVVLNRTESGYWEVGSFYYTFLKDPAQAMPNLVCAWYIGQDPMVGRTLAHCFEDLGMYTGSWRIWKALLKQDPANQILVNNEARVEKLLREHIGLRPRETRDRVSRGLTIE